MVVVKYSFLIAISVLVFGFSTRVVSLEEELTKVLTSFDGLEISFTQEVYDQYANLIEVSSGICRVSKPSIEWRTTEPYRQTLLLSGDTLQIFDPDLEQLIVKTVESESTPLNLLRQKDIRFDDFIVTELENGEDTKTRRYLFSPVSREAAYSGIEIETRKQELVLIKLIGLAGEQTRVHFSGKRQIFGEDLLFQLVVPEGTDIVEG